MLGGPFFKMKASMVEIFKARREEISYGQFNKLNKMLRRSLK